jgi:hypothetical protein
MHKLIKLVLISSILITAADSYGQKTNTKKPYEIRDMEKFIGIWESDVEYTVDSVRYKVTYRMNFRKTADGFGLNMDEAYTDSALGSLRAANLIGFGSEDKKIHWYRVDNMGITYERIGYWKDSDNLYFDHSSNKGEKKYNEVISFTFRGNDEFLYKQSFFLDGKEIKKIRGTFKRRQPANPQPKQ